MPRPPLRRIVPLAILACASVAAAAVARRRGAAADPPDTHLAEAMMGDLATGEGMPEAPPS